MLDQVEIFHGLSDEELKALEGSSTTRAFPKNTVVIHENDPADSLFVIESGKVKVYCSDKNGKEFIMNTLGPGDYFGELALLDDSTRSASVRTVEKSEFRIVMKEDFSSVLDDHPNITQQLISNLARQVANELLCNVRVIVQHAREVFFHHNTELGFLHCAHRR